MKNFIIYSFIFIFIVLYLEIGIKVISAGLPYSYARDEKTQMARTMNLPINKFDPLQRTKPHFWFYALFSFYSFDYLLGRLTGEFYDKDDYIILYKSFPERIFFTGRLFSLICGIAVLLIFIFWAKKYFNNFLLIFILYLLVLKDLYFYSVSSVLLADMFFVFLYILSTATIYYSVLFKNKKYFFLSAALIGLTVSARQPGIFLFVPLLYGIITSLQENKIKIFFLCCLTAAFIFSITSPYYVLNFYNSFKGIILQFKNLSDTQEFSRLNIVNARGFSIVSYL
nr:glycosyltransferase family 39 protein [Candidatus Dependentiae bacterium]